MRENTLNGLFAALPASIPTIRGWNCRNQRPLSHERVTFMTGNEVYT